MNDQQPDRPDQGFRSLPHTADLRIEAWASTREECIGQAVLGMVSSFVGTATLRPQRTLICEFKELNNEDLLAAVLNQVIYELDVSGEIPVTIEIASSANTTTVRYGQSAINPDHIIGAPPKAVTLSDLDFRHQQDQWRCAVTIDV